MENGLEKSVNGGMGTRQEAVVVIQGRDFGGAEDWEGWMESRQD